MYHTALIPWLRRQKNGTYTHCDTNEPADPATERSQGDLIDMGVPAPRNVVTFSHELGSWITSCHGYWVISTAQSAHTAVVNGATLLEGAS